MRILVWVGLAWMGTFASPEITSLGGRYLIRRESTGMQTRVRVIERAAGKERWAYTAEDPRLFTWASGDRAVAFIDEVVGRRQPDHWWFELVIWRPTKGTTVIRRIEPFARFEVVTSLAWAPDASRILLVGPYTQGAGDQDLRRVWCVHWQTGKSHLLTPLDVGRAEWVDARAVRIWQTFPFSAKERPRIIRCRR
jgi:hypothetical protein